MRETIYIGTLLSLITLTLGEMCVEDADGDSALSRQHELRRN